MAEPEEKAPCRDPQQMQPGAWATCLSANEEMEAMATKGYGVRCGVGL